MKNIDEAFDSIVGEHLEAELEQIGAIGEHRLHLPRVCAEQGRPIPWWLFASHIASDLSQGNLRPGSLSNEYGSPVEIGLTTALLGEGAIASPFVAAAVGEAMAVFCGIELGKENCHDEYAQAVRRFAENKALIRHNASMHRVARWEWRNPYRKVPSNTFPFASEGGRLYRTRREASPQLRPFTGPDFSTITAAELAFWDSLSRQRRTVFRGERALVHEVLKMARARQAAVEEQLRQTARPIQQDYGDAADFLAALSTYRQRVDALDRWAQTCRVLREAQRALQAPEPEGFLSSEPDGTWSLVFKYRQAIAASAWGDIAERIENGESVQSVPDVEESDSLYKTVIADPGDDLSPLWPGRTTHVSLACYRAVAALLEDPTSPRRANRWFVRDPGPSAFEWEPICFEQPISQRIALLATAYPPKAGAAFPGNAPRNKEAP